MSVAKAYAKALYETASEKKAQAEAKATCDQVEQQLDQFVGLLKQSKELNIALIGPVTTTKEKANLVRALCEKTGTQGLTAQFLELLASKGRMGHLSEVLAGFVAARLQAEGGIQGSLTSAEEISSADVDQLAQSFSRKLGKKVAFQVTVDPSLLAGVRVTIGGTTYDGSLKSQLDALRGRFVTGLSVR